jgi:mannan endo-1,4-beta-mannosidase
MDFYVRQLATTQAHDEFYVNQTIINAFMNYTTQVVSRYVNSPAVLSWYGYLINQSLFSHRKLSSGN